MAEIHRGGFTLDDTKQQDVKGNWLMKNEFEVWKTDVNGKLKKLTDDIAGIKMQLGRKKPAETKLNETPNITEGGDK